MGIYVVFKSSLVAGVTVCSLRLKKLSLSLRLLLLGYSEVTNINFYQFQFNLSCRRKCRVALLSTAPQICRDKYILVHGFSDSSIHSIVLIINVINAL